MCDNARECAAAAAQGFGPASYRRPLEDAPDAAPTGKPPRSVHPPRSLADKLHVGPGMRVSLVGLPDPGIAEAVKARAELVSEERYALDRSDVVVYHACSRVELARIPELRRATAPQGALWVLWPRTSSLIRHADVRGAGRAAGLVAAGAASISDTLTGIKFVCEGA